MVQTATGEGGVKVLVCLDQPWSMMLILLGNAITGGESGDMPVTEGRPEGGICIRNGAGERMQRLRMQTGDCG